MNEEVMSIFETITDKEENEKIEQKYRTSVSKLEKEIREMGLSEENESKLLRLTDYIFHIHEHEEYYGHPTNDELTQSSHYVTSYDFIFRDIVKITGFKEESVSFFDSMRTVEVLDEATTIAYSRAIKFPEAKDFQKLYVTEWFNNKKPEVLDFINDVEIAIETLSIVATSKKTLQKILSNKNRNKNTPERFKGITYAKLTEEFLSNVFNSLYISNLLRLYNIKNKNRKEVVTSHEPADQVEDNSTENLYENYSFIAPVNAVFDNTKVGRMIFKKEIQDALRTEKFKDGIPVPVSPKNAKRESDVTLAIDFSNFKTSKYLTGDHKDVLNAVNSIIEAGNDKFTLSSLYEQVYQKPPKRSYQLEELKKTVDDLRGILITIDYTQHMKMNGTALDGETYMIRRQNALSLDEVTVSINGMKTTVYKLLQEPPTYTYPKACKQIVTIPKKYLETKSVSNTEQARMIKRYVVERINAYNGGRVSSTIKYDEIYNEYAEASGIDISEMTKEKKKNARDITKKILNDFKNNEFITGYKENATTVNGKKTFTSVTFTCKKS